MKLKWLGHACFELTLADGTVILTDPFDESVGYPVPRGEADIVTVSHQHHDHNDASHLARAGVVLSEPGEYAIGSARVRAVSSFHDGERGAKRGPNLIFVIEADGLRVAHMGDLGHELEGEPLAAVSGADVMLLPVGGFYTIDAEQAERVRRAAKPRLAIPMHYLTPYIRFPIADERPFLALNGGQRAQKGELLIDAESIAKLPAVLALAI